MTPGAFSFRPWPARVPGRIPRAARRICPSRRGSPSAHGFRGRPRWREARRPCRRSCRRRRRSKVTTAVIGKHSQPSRPFRRAGSRGRARWSRPASCRRPLRARSRRLPWPVSKPSGPTMRMRKMPPGFRSISNSVISYGLRREPLLQKIGVGLGLPHQVARGVDGAFEHQVKLVGHVILLVPEARCRYFSKRSACASHSERRSTSHCSASAIALPSSRRCGPGPSSRCGPVRSPRAPSDAGARPAGSSAAAGPTR